MFLLQYIQIIVMHRETCTSDSRKNLALWLIVQLYVIHFQNYKCRDLFIQNRECVQKWPVIVIIAFSYQIHSQNNGNHMHTGGIIIHIFACAAFFIHICLYFYIYKNTTPCALQDFKKKNIPCFNSNNP